MPSLPPVPQTMKVTLGYTISTDTVNVNNLHFKYAGSAPDNSMATTWAGTISTAWNTNLAPMCHPSVSLTGVRVVDLASTTGALGVNAGVHAGTRAGTALPAGTCALVNYAMQRRYRGGKPRTYLPAGIETDILDGQHWKTTFISSMFNAWNGFLNQVITTLPAGLSGVQLVNVSYYHDFTIKYGPTGRAYNQSKIDPTGPHVDLLTTTGINALFASQRRRVRP